ncbi:hypothetical protein ONE63_010343 [Megalurothrips usitatus]|uniref:DDE Tnp4 domain-containing protein n=1 Tax=Megalurothrips usitatus TaxID=439358 RepID=A0AAV7XIG6_9NEOP|nr:hypothetical protein ONE63_010343 [Megalurothrips usitatus]
MVMQYHFWSQRKRMPRRRWWVRPVNRVRDTKGLYNNLVKELMTDDHEEFFGLYRMWPEQFQVLVDAVHPYLKKNSIRTAIPTKIRVAVTLLHLSQGSTARLQHVIFRIGKSTILKIIHETTKAIWKALQPTVLKHPNKEEWKKIADDFMQMWQFPNCVGAIDGKHMRIQAPPLTGSKYWNYKSFFSMVLLAICDANYKFTWVDIGQYGSVSDGGVWANTDLAQDLANNEVDLPDPCPLPQANTPFPYVFIGDEAFPLTSHMMRPYPRRDLDDDKHIFNYRLSRARRCIENAFGILTARWRILHQPLCMAPENAESVFKALACLHNFVMMGEAMVNPCDRLYAPPQLVDAEEPDGSMREGEWRRHVSPHFAALGRVGGNRSNLVAYGERDYLCSYIVSDIGYSQCPWQAEYALRGHNINPD